MKQISIYIYNGGGGYTQNPYPRKMPDITHLLSKLLYPIGRLDLRTLHNKDYAHRVACFVPCASFGPEL